MMTARELTARELATRAGDYTAPSAEAILLAEILIELRRAPVPLIPASGLAGALFGAPPDANETVANDAGADLGTPPPPPPKKRARRA